MRQFSHLIGRLFDYFKTISQNIFDLIFRESVFCSPESVTKCDQIVKILYNLIHTNTQIREEK